MAILRIQRILDVMGNYEDIRDNANDWTHFQFLHHRSHYCFKLLAQNEKLQFFIYRARILYPLPFSKSYFVVREALPEIEGYQQIYYGLNGEMQSYLKSSCERLSGGARVVGEFVFNVPWFYAFAKPIVALIFRLRMFRVAQEDEVYLREKPLAEKFQTKSNNNPNICLPFNSSAEIDLAHWGNQVQSLSIAIKITQKSCP